MLDKKNNLSFAKPYRLRSLKLFKGKKGKKTLRIKGKCLIYRLIHTCTYIENIINIVKSSLYLIFSRLHEDLVKLPKRVTDLIENRNTVKMAVSYMKIKTLEFLSIASWLLICFASILAGTLITAVYVYLVTSI